MIEHSIMDLYDTYGKMSRRIRTVIRVLASQSENPWTSKQVLGYKKRMEHADALAVAPALGKELGA